MLVRRTGSAMITLLVMVVVSALAEDGPPITAVGREAASSNAAVTLWTMGSALMPAWGLYPNGEAYGGTKSLGTHTAWRSGRLTWLAEFPRADVYQVFVRRYSGYGETIVRIDEATPVKGGRGWIAQDGSGARYMWEHIGEARVTSGRHHVDLQVAGMFDAVVFTTDTNLNPASDRLPEPEKSPVVRAPRTYRDDSHLENAARSRGFVVGSAPAYEEMLNDFVPTSDQVLDSLRLWGATNQYVDGGFVIRGLRAMESFTATLRELTGPENARIDEAGIDLRVVHLRRRTLVLFESTVQSVLLPDLLLRDDRTALPPQGKQGGFGGGTCATAIPAHESRQFHVCILVPEGSPPGLYRGVVELSVAGDRDRRLLLPVELENLPIDLKPVEGYYSIYYPSQPVDATQKRVEGNYVNPERFSTELRDQVRHGVNAAILYGCGATLKLAKDAGMTAAPVLMTWNTEPNEVAQAKALGFPDVYYYGVDEPTGERIEICRKEATRRALGGFHMFTAINSVAAQEATKDLIDRPVYSINVFNGPDNPAVMYARHKGFRPISYWTTAVSFPAYYRAMSGLYNTRCGFLGTAPWAYQDYPDNRLYDERQNYHVVSYPDAAGEPIPTLNWEAFRAGVDDVRYLQALDRMLADADRRLKLPDPPVGLAEEAAKVRAVRAARFESIAGRIHEYIGFKPDVLDATRRELAEATLHLKELMTGEP